MSQTPDTAAPIVPMYGVGLNDFMIGGVSSKWVANPNAPSNCVSDLIWDFLREMNFDVLVVSGQNDNFGNYTYFDIISGASSRDSNQRIMATRNLHENAGFGRELQFYPFDSIQTPNSWNWLFTSLSGGTSEYNDDEKENDLPLQERVYETLSDTGLIASTIAFNYDTATGRDVHEANALFDDQRRSASTLYYIIVNGHMYSGGGAANSDEIFRVAVYHEIPAGKKYLDNNLNEITAGSDVELLIDSFAVTKADLIDGSPSVPFEKYRTISYEIDMATRPANTGPGPIYASQPHGDNGGSRTIDIRVYWTGKEKAALRSIAVRDRLGETYLGTRSTDSAARADLEFQIRRTMLGYRGAGVPAEGIDTMFTPIIGIEVGSEPQSTDFAVFNELNRRIRDTFNLSRYYAALGESYTSVPGDSVPAFMWDLANPEFHDVANQSAIFLFNYFNERRDTVPVFGYWNSRGGDEDPVTLFETPHHQVPSFKQHNGGRGHLPELMDMSQIGDSAYDLTLQQRVEDYETTIQRMYFGRYDPDNTTGFYEVYPNSHLGEMLDQLGDAATLSRQTGRRLIPLPGVVAHIELRDSVISAGPTTTYGIDTLLGHMPEQSEIWGIVNSELCYGARGVIWYRFGNDSEMAVPVDGDSTVWVTNDAECCIGSSGFRVGDTTENFLDYYELEDVNSTKFSCIVELGLPEIVIPDLYIGYLDRTQAVKSINRWLRRIGPELNKLRWRDSYSMHFTQE